MNDYTIIDAHSHLWLKQEATVDGKEIRLLPNGRTDFMGEERQMLPPFILDGRNTAEIFLSNMDYARVSAAVVTQEFIDGSQDDYLIDVKRRYPDRFIVSSLCDCRRPGFLPTAMKAMDTGFDGIAIPGHRLPLDGPGKVSLTDPEMMQMFKEMERRDLFLSLCLNENGRQVSQVEEIVAECPDLRIAIGHFGMVTTPGWLEQIKLARHPNVMIESGGITWLFNSEFYPFHGAMKAIREAADLVGIDKLMWGSDYPRTITAITYRMSYDFVIKSTILTEEEKRAFLGLNAIRFYGIVNPVKLPYIKNMSE